MKKEKTKNYNIDYGYTTFLALYMNLRYDGSRKLSIDALKKYPKLLIPAIMENLSDTNITMINEIDNFEKFLEDNKEIIEENNGFIILNERVSIEDLNKILYMYMYPFTEIAIDTIKYNYNIKNILGLKGIENTLLKLESIETLIEEYYLLKSFNEKITIDDKIKIQNLMKRRNLFYYKLLCLSSTTITDFEDEINQMLEDPYETNYPIDINNNYDTLFDDEVYITDEVLANPYLIAYFTEQPLSFLEYLKIYLIFL